MAKDSKQDNKEETPGSADLANDQTTGEELGTEEVQAKMDVETDKGYRGTRADPTPQSHYTVAGVTAGLPTPETHPEQAQKAGSNKFAHVDEAAEGQEKARQYYEGVQQKKGEQ